MSFNVSFRFQSDAGIDRVFVEWDDGYASSWTTDFNIDVDTSIDELDVSLGSGYEFGAWTIYQVSGGLMTKIATSSRTPYTPRSSLFSDGGSYVITAESDAPPSEWGTDGENERSISSNTSFTVDCDQGIVYIIPIRFQTVSGEATFSSSGSYDTVGYLTSETPAINTSNGVVTNALISNDDSGSGSNFSFSYSVYPGQLYYLCVRHFEIESSGSFNVSIIPPGGSSVITGDGFYIYTGSGSSQGWKKVTPYIYNGSGWVECQPAICTAVDSTNNATWVVGTNE